MPDKAYKGLMIPKVCVLLSTYNGEKYIKTLIESVLTQKNVEVFICVRDDGSTDSTCDILKEYEGKGYLKWFAGNNIGPAQSFLALVDKEDGFDYYSFADQDDLWLEDKLDIAINSIKRYDDIPTLYYGAARVADRDLNWNGTHTREYYISSFSQAVVQSNAVGCTCVFNRLLRNIIAKSKPDYIFMHDAWVHKTCIISGGKLIFDKDVHVLYRQHGNNVVGSKRNLGTKIKDYIRKIQTKECVRSRQITSLLNCYEDIMSAEDIIIAQNVSRYRIDKQCKREILSGSIKTGYWLLDAKFKLAVLLEVF